MFVKFCPKMFKCAHVNSPATILLVWVSHTCKWLTSHIYTTHVTHMNKSHHTYECVTSHMKCTGSLMASAISAVACVDVLRRCKVLMSTVSISSSAPASRDIALMSSAYVNRSADSRFSCGWATSRKWMTPVNRINESCRTWNSRDDGLCCIRHPPRLRGAQVMSYYNYLIINLHVHVLNICVLSHSRHLTRRSHKGESPSMRTRV